MISFFMNVCCYFFPATCHDENANCESYGTELCDDVKFFSWVNENCQKHCNRCGNANHGSLGSLGSLIRDISMSQLVPFIFGKMIHAYH